MNLPENPKDILVTGASGAIGSAIARRLASAGHRVHLTSRDPARLSRLESDLAKGPGKAFTSRMDLSDLAQCQAAVAQFFSRAIHPFGLVCNAGHLGILGRFEEIDFAAWQQSITENFLAHAAMIQSFAKRFKTENRRTASIVILSGAGLGGPSTWTHLSSYSTAKAALTHLVEALSSELRERDITINAISPGAVRSGLTDQAIAAGPQQAGPYAAAAQKCKDSGGISPDLAAELVEFLMSSEARGITGRLLSARFDQKALKENSKQVENDPNLYRLRRIDNELYLSKP